LFGRRHLRNLWWTRAGVLRRLDLRGRESLRQPGILRRVRRQPATLLRRSGVRDGIHLLGRHVLGMRQPRAAVLRYHLLAGGDL
jgi:hypothetical protein